MHRLTMCKVVQQFDKESERSSNKEYHRHHLVCCVPTPIFSSVTKPTYVYIYLRLFLNYLGFCMHCLNTEQQIQLFLPNCHNVFSRGFGLLSYGVCYNWFLVTRVAHLHSEKMGKMSQFILHYVIKVSTEMRVLTNTSFNSKFR